MRKLTFKKSIDEATFQPLQCLYLDDEKTQVSFSIEQKMDAKAFHGDNVKDYFVNLLIEELNNGNNLTDEEDISYRKIIGDLF